MKQVLALSLLTAAVSALPLTRTALHRREVPQELSHKQFLNLVKTSLDLNNPDEIVDPVFGLLGNAAAADGQGKIEDPDCLQQVSVNDRYDLLGMTID